MWGVIFTKARHLPTYVYKNSKNNEEIESHELVAKWQVRIFLE